MTTELSVLTALHRAAKRLARFSAACVVTAMFLSGSTGYSQAAPAAKPADGSQTASSDPDSQRVLGSWKAIHSEHDGKESSPGANKIVLDKGRGGSYGIPLTYKIDDTKSPKEIDFYVYSPRTYKGQKPLIKAIYKFEGENLVVCLQNSPTKAYPKDFTTSRGDGRELLVLKRLQPLPANAPDADYDRSLQDAIRGWIASLEAKHFEQYVETSTPPEKLAKIKESQNEWKQMVETGTALREHKLAELRVVLKLTPHMRENDSLAIFMLNNVAYEESSGALCTAFFKQNGKWYPEMHRDSASLMELYDQAK